MRRRVIGLFALLACVAPGTSRAYVCSNSCVAPDCICPSEMPPGGLAPGDTPQMVLLTFDDSVNSDRFDLVYAVLTNHWNPNGSALQASFYVNTDWSDYWLMEKLYGEGHEIAIHTMTHTTHTNTTLPEWRAEVVGCRRALGEWAEIPREAITGFRAPYLEYNDDLFELLEEAKFAYDSSMIEYPGVLSTNAADLIWPYSLDCGIAQRCITGLCPTNVFPGMMEVPMWDLLDTNGESVASMDPTGTYEQVIGLLKQNFNTRYNGNRCPLGIWLHAFWLTNSVYSAALDDFLTWVEEHPDAWMVSDSDLVAFMHDPQTIADADTFPPFMTQTNAFCSTNERVRCPNAMYTFHTCGECPIFYPRPDTLYAVPVDMTGGVVVGYTIEDDWGSGFLATGAVSSVACTNAAYWELVFQMPHATMRHIWDATVATNGSNLVVHPAGWQLPLEPGSTNTFGFTALRTGGDDAFLTQSFQLYDQGVRQPILTNIEWTAEGMALGWDESAFGFRIEQADALSGIWTQQIDVHASLALTNTPSGPGAYYRIQPIP